MPVEYSVNFGGAYVEAVAKGILTTNEVCEYEATLESDSRIRPGFIELFDVTLISESRIDKKGLKRIAKTVLKNRKRSQGSKLAIVVSKKDSFERARYYERIAYNSQNVIVFNGREVA